MFSSSDPEPYGLIAEQIFQDLSQSSYDLAELNRIYIENRMLFGKVVPFNARSFFFGVKFLNPISQSMIRFDNLRASLDNQFISIDENIKRLSNISVEVSARCRNIVKKINSARSILIELEKFKLVDDDFLEISKSLDEWELTVHQQIPITFIAEVQNSASQIDDKVFVAKLFRFINNLEPEINNIQSIIDGWKSDYESIILVRDECIRVNEDILTKMRIITSDTSLKISWEQLENRVHSLNNKLSITSIDNLSVNSLGETLFLLSSLKEQQNSLFTDINNIQYLYQDLVERFRKKEPQHQLEWLKNVRQSLRDAETYNAANWKDKDQVGELGHKIDDLLSRHTNLISQIEGGVLSASNIERYSKLFISIDTDFKQIDVLYKGFFAHFQEIRKLEGQTKNQLTQYYPSLKLLDEISFSNPVIKKLAKNNINKFLQDIEEVNHEFTIPGQGTVINKAKRWDGLSSRILIFVQKIKKKLDEENEGLQSKLESQVEIFQDFLALNEPVFINAINLLKEKNGETLLNAENNSNIGILELVHNIKERSDYWQKLTASTNALNDISGPILNQLEKLENARSNLVKAMADADEIIPEELSWPPTTLRLSVEREEFSSLENKYKTIKKERRNAIHLMAVLSEVTEEYKDLSLTIRNKNKDAKEEQKGIEALEKRLNKSIELWKKLIQIHQDNLVLNDNIQDLLGGIEEDYRELKFRYQSGRIPYSQAYQMLRVICRKIDQDSVEFDNRRIIDISGELQQKL